jgi:ribose transport system permease protein
MTTLTRRLPILARLPSELGVLAAILALVGYFSLASPVFFDTANFVNIGRQTTLLAIAAFAMTFIILSGEIDLSIGAVASLIGMFTAIALRDGLPWFAAFGIAVVSGMCFGLLNGLLTVIGRVPSFIVTLGVFSITRGVAFAITNRTAVAVTDDPFLNIFAGAQIGGVAIAVIYAALLFLLLHLLLTRTSFGTSVYAVGGNPNAARLSGIPVARVKILVFVLAGALIGIAATLQTARLASAPVEAARNLELDAIAAVVLGGTSFSGGRGSLVRTVLGALLIGVLNNGLQLTAVDSYFQLVIKGSIIIGAVLLDRWARGGR